MHNLKSIHIKLSPENRLYKSKLPIIGLTGGIATGKSTVSTLLANKGHFIVDADKLVKSIYTLDSTIRLIQNICPNALINGAVAFPKLREIFFNNDLIRSKIESHIYKELPSAFNSRLKDLKGHKFVVYDVPLLFEKKIDKLVDLSICVFTPLEEQVSRLVARDRTSLELAHKILASQLSIDEKRRLADYTILNTGTIDDLTTNVNSLFQDILN